MNASEYMLATLAQKASEIAQTAGDALRFGLNETHTPRDTVTFGGQLTKQVYECLAIMEMLQEFDPKSMQPPFPPTIERLKNDQKEQVNFFLHHHAEHMKNK